MSKVQRDAEIERIVDIATAEENARLQAGGLGPGDYASEADTIKLGGQRYLEPRTQGVLLGVADDPPYRDEYREMIEAPAPEPEPDAEPSNRTATGELIRQGVEGIRGRVMSYEGQARADVGYLLEVIDAYESGRL